METTNMKVLILILIVVSPFCDADTSLFTSQTLIPNQVLQTGAFSLRFQIDCNLVLYDGARVAWASGTHVKGTNCFATLQDDGNLVVFSSPDGRVIWASGTAREKSTGYELRLQADRNLVIFGPSKNVIWASNTQIRSSDTKNLEDKFPGKT